MTFINFKKSQHGNLIATLKFILFKLSFMMTIAQFATPKVLAAEEIIVNYGLLQFNLSIDTLRVYAEEGEITEELASYANLLTPQQLETLRTGLLVKPEIEPLSIAQFFYSYQGEKLLERVGQIVRTQAGQPGFYAIRSALILAAASEEGLTPLNFLETFPTSGIQVDSGQGFQFIEELSGIIQTTEKAIAAIEEEALAEAAENQSFIPGINGNGNFAYNITTLSLKDESRNRSFPVDLYLPEHNSDRQLPLIVISHGLGSDRESLGYFARYMASYGFAVAVPEHPGSNAEQIQNLLEGFANDVTPPEEFIDRPLDITHLLDQLEDQYGSIISTEDVGIIGQSFGAYTSLALAGAELNFTALTAACDELDKSFNVSLFLQCLALELPPENTPTDLRDPRITSAIAINPLTSAIFGEEGIAKIDIPVMIVSGSADPVTPALSEQIKPFIWLDAPEKYLVLMKGGTHFSVLTQSSGSIPVPAAAIGPDPQIAHNYIKQLGLLFFSNFYSARNPQFGSLNSSYAASISQPIMPLSLIESLAEEKLEILGRK